MKRKRKTLKMENISNVVNVAEFIPGRLYFITLNTNVNPKSTACAHFFDVDTSKFYDSFFYDFGPLNLTALYRYCKQLDSKLSQPMFRNKKIIHYTDMNDESRVNAAFLIGAYAVIKLNFDPENAFHTLTNGSKDTYIEFRDASIGQPYTLSLLDCLKAVKKAFYYGFFNFDNFDFVEYEYYDLVENGDLNWIVPEKFIAFCGPHDRSTFRKGYPVHSPETYFSYFHRHNVTTIVRLNVRVYDAGRFIEAGFDHRDLIFNDGTVPSDRILNSFITICENANGVIAVHCKAGLGRTGTLIASYIMKHYKFTAEEAIAWIRICRPGSIIAHQQTWLIEKQNSLWAAGDLYRKKMRISEPPKHNFGIYSIPDNINNNNNINVVMNVSNANVNLTGIVERVDSMEIDDQDINGNEETDTINVTNASDTSNVTDTINTTDDNDNMTQGDRLNQIKLQRFRAKRLPQNNVKLTERKNINVRNNVKKVNCVGAQSNSTTNTTTTTTTATTTTTTTTTTTNRVLRKRNELNDTQITRRCSQRKLTIPTTILNVSSSKEKLKSIKKNETKCLTTTTTTSSPKKKENLNSLLKNSNENNLLTTTNIVTGENIMVSTTPSTTTTTTITTTTTTTSVNNKNDIILLKRGKRALNLEKDKSNPHSVKVLRRSHGQSSSKLNLTTVKLNNSI